MLDCSHIFGAHDPPISLDPRILNMGVLSEFAVNPISCGIVFYVFGFLLMQRLG
jgi:hypothetical protein